MISNMFWETYKNKIFLIAGAGILVAAFFGIRWYGNAQWAKGEERGRQNVADMLIKEKEEEWAAREKEISLKEKQATQKLDDLTYAANTIHQARATLIKNFDITLKEMEAERVEAYRYAGSVPDTDLIDELRAISRELAGTSKRPGDEADTGTAP